MWAARKSTTDRITVNRRSINADGMGLHVANASAHVLGSGHTRAAARDAADIYIYDGSL